MKQNLMIKGSCEEQQKSSTFGDVRVGVATQRYDIVKCHNYFASLPDSMITTHPRATRIDYSSNPPTPCIYRSKVTLSDRLKHMTRKNRKNVLSKWQEKLIASQHVDEPQVYLPVTGTPKLKKSMYIDTRISRSQKKKIRRLYRQVSSEERWRDPLTTSSDDEVEDISRKEFYSLRTMFHKLPKECLSLIYLYLFDDPSEEDLLHEMIDEQIHRRRLRNNARAERRAKHKFQRSMMRLSDWCDRRYNIIQAGKVNYFTACLLRYCPGGEILYDIPSYYYDWWSDTMTDVPTSVLPMYNLQSDWQTASSGMYKYTREMWHDFLIERRIALINELDQVESLRMVSHNDVTVLVNHLIDRLAYQPVAPVYNLQANWTSEDSIPMRVFLEAFSYVKDPEGYDYTAVCNFAENLVTTMVLVNHSTSWKLALLQIKQWITMTFGVHLCSSVLHWLEGLFPTELETQAWDGFNYKQLFSDWKGIYNGEFLNKIKKIVACIAALGFCTLGKIPFCTERFCT
jgi:hypothetical protein